MARSPLVGESDAEEHDIIPCAPLTSRSAALDTNHLKVDGAKNSEHRNQHTAVIVRINKIVPIVRHDTRSEKG